MPKCPACNHKRVKGVFFAALMFKKQVRCDNCGIYLQIRDRGVASFVLLALALVGSSFLARTYGLSATVEIFMLILVAMVLHVVHSSVAVRLYAA